MPDSAASENSSTAATQVAPRSMRTPPATNSAVNSEPLPANDGARHGVNDASGHELRRFHFAVLSAALLAAIAAVTMQVRPDGKVEFAFLPGVPLPETCVSRRLFGRDCLGCGITRSVIHLAHGRIRDSWQTHPAGWLAAAIIVGQIPYRCWKLRRPRNG